MSEPDDLTPLSETPREAPEGTPKLSRSPYVALGAAALVVSTVFATVAALAGARDEQAAPLPQSKDSIQTDAPETYTTDPSATSSPDRSRDKPSRERRSKSSTTSKDAATSKDGTSSDQPTSEPDDRPTTTKPTTPPTSEPPPNKAPVANFSFTCDGLTCDFDGGSSTDPDGSIASYSWSFGGSKVTASHTFGNAGTFDVTLTVIDDRGQNATQTKSVTVSTPTTTSSH